MPNHCTAYLSKAVPREYDFSVNWNWTPSTTAVHTATVASDFDDLMCSQGNYTPQNMADEAGFVMNNADDEDGDSLVAQAGFSITGASLAAPLSASG
jgi:hypothetical protein